MQIVTQQMNITKRPATEEDKDFLYALNKSVYKTLVEKIIGTWDEKFQKEYFEKKWNKSGYRIVEKDKNKIGTIWVEYEKSHHTLKEIQILPDFQNQGIGTELIQSEIMLAKNSKVPIRLRLLKGNRSQFLYERFGFKVYKEAGDYILMELDV